jgi:anti-anti-sigma factor
MNSGVKIIQPSGILDSIQATEVRQQITELVESKAEIVLVDLQNVTFIDSSGLGLLAIAFKAIRDAGGKLYLCSVGQQPQMLLELTGMEQVFQIFPSRDEFMKTLVPSDR